nr:hypothetical protein [Mycolicibacterium hassiacum]
MAYSVMPGGASRSEVDAEAVAGTDPKGCPLDTALETPTDPEVERLGALTLPYGPIADITTRGDVIIAAHYGADAVSLLDANTLHASGVIPVPGEPFAVARTADQVVVATTATGCDAVSVIDVDRRTVSVVYPLAFSVSALAVSPNGKRVYAGRTGDGYADVAVIDLTAERVGTIDIGSGPGLGLDACVTDPTGTVLYVATTDARGSALVVVDTETARVRHRIPVGPPIRDLGCAEDAVFVLTSDRVRGGAVQVVDLAVGRVTKSVELGAGAPTQLVLSSDRTRAYVVDYDRITVLCPASLELVNTVAVAPRPSCVAVDDDSDRLYVADYTGTVTTLSVAAAMPLLYSQFVATDPLHTLEAATA